MQVQDPNANDRSKVGHEWTNNLGTSIDDPQRTLRSALPHDSLRIPSLALEVSSEHFSSTRDSMAPSSVASSSSRPQGERESGASPSPGPSASPEHVKQEGIILSSLRNRVNLKLLSLRSPRNNGSVIATNQRENISVKTAVLKMWARTSTNVARRHASTGNGMNLKRMPLSAKEEKQSRPQRQFTIASHTTAPNPQQ